MHGASTSSSSTNPTSTEASSSGLTSTEPPSSDFPSGIAFPRLTGSIPPDPTTLTLEDRMCHNISKNLTENLRTVADDNLSKIEELRREVFQDTYQEKRLQNSVSFLTKELGMIKEQLEDEQSVNVV